MSFKTTKDKLKTILDGLTGTTSAKLFAESFGYLEPSPKKFPCAMIGTFAGSSEQTIDSAYNGTTMQFVIRCYFENENDQSTHDLLLTTLDSLLAELRKDDNYTLGGTVQRLDVAPNIIVYYTDQTEQPVIGFDIVINVLKLNQIF